MQFCGCDTMDIDLVSAFTKSQRTEDKQSVKCISILTKYVFT